MQHLQELLPQLQREGHRPLIFSQWTLVLDLLEVLLEHLGLSFLRVDGETVVAERLQLCDMYAPRAPHSSTYPLLLQVSRPRTPKQLKRRSGASCSAC